MQRPGPSDYISGSFYILNDYTSLGSLAHNAPVNSRFNLGLLDNGNNGLRAIPFNVRFFGFPGLGFRKAGTQGYRESGGTQWYRDSRLTHKRAS